MARRHHTLRLRFQRRLCRSKLNPTCNQRIPLENLPKVRSPEQRSGLHLLWKHSDGMLEQCGKSRAKTNDQLAESRLHIQNRNADSRNHARRWFPSRAESLRPRFVRASFEFKHQAWWVLKSLREWRRLQIYRLSETLSNFEKARAGETDAYGVQYDTGSVMHYSSTAFSKNGQKTIEALVSTFGLGWNLWGFSHVTSVIWSEKGRRRKITRRKRNM